MATEAERLLEHAAAVADAQPPLWTDGPEHSDGKALAELRIIADIARVYRERLGPLISADGVPASDAWPETDLTEPWMWAHLRVSERLGAGAFGEVFRAWDTNLGREVALKLLRPGLGRSTRSESVLHEGQRLARVSHPNVVAVFGAQQEGGRVGIWGELLTGRTLAQIVERDGPMSAKEASVCGEAICRALAAAHRQGVLHRDVKAQNVMREKGGRIVLMDFGLGLDVDGAGNAVSLAGTPLYLAPELFSGGRPSVRSDIYGVGVLLFFLVTGTMPVVGRSLADIGERHRLNERKRLQDLRGDLSAAFAQVIDRALAPDPQNRFESCGEMQAALAMADGVMSQSRQKTHGSFKFVGHSIAAALAAAITTAVVSWTAAPSSETVPLAAVIEPPPGTRFTESGRNVAAISPNAKHLAFVATRNGQSLLWVQSLATGEAHPLVDTVGAASPFWSPDSQTIAFFDAAGLRTISLGGVRSETLAPITEERGGSWNRDGVILFAPGPRDGLFTTSPQGGPIRPLLRPDIARGEIGYLWPTFLPDGQRFVFFVWSNDEGVRGIYLGHLGSQERTRLVGAATSAIVADGHLMFVREGTLVAQRIDNQGRPDGPARPVIANVAANPVFRSAVTSSETGTVVYTPFQAADLTQLTWFDQSGKKLQTIDTPAKFRNPAISADGRYLVAQLYHDSISELRLFDLQRGDQSRIPHRANAEFPVWSPDGRLAFAATDQGWLNIFVTRIDGDTEAEPLFSSDADKMPNDWSPDGRYLSFTSLAVGGSYDLYVLPVSPRAAAALPIATSRYEEADGHFSPDSTQLAYISTMSGQPEVYVRRFPDGVNVRRVSTQGGLSPTWTSDGTLYFLDFAGQIMRVRVPADERSAVPTPAKVMQAGIITAGTSRNHYAFTSDGRRIVINYPASQERSTSIRIISDWLALVPKS